MYIKRHPLGRGNLTFGKRRRRFPIIFIVLYVAILGAAGIVVWRFNDVQPVVLAALGPPPTPTTSPVTLTQMGEDAYMSGNMLEATEYYQMAVDIEPESIEYRTRLAHMIVMQLNDATLPDALAIADGTIQIAPEDARGYASRARILNWQGQYADAAQAALQAVELDPDSALAHAYLAESYTDLGRLRQALEQAEMAVQMDPFEVEARRSYAYVLEWYGRYNDAVQQYQQALRLHPNRMDLLYGLARNYRGMGQTDMAVRTFQQIITRVPSDPLPYVEIGKTYFEIRDDAAAQEYLSRAVELICAECPLTVGVSEMTDAEYRSSRVLPETVYMPAWRRLAMVYFTRRNYEDAIDLFEEAIGWAEIHEEEVPIEAYYVTASAYYYLDQCTRAIPRAVTALEVYEEREIDDANALKNILSVFVLCSDYTQNPYLYAGAGYTDGFPDGYERPDVLIARDDDTSGE